MLVVFCYSQLAGQITKFLVKTCGQNQSDVIFVDAHGSKGHMFCFAATQQTKEAIEDQFKDGFFVSKKKAGTVLKFSKESVREGAIF